MQYFKHIHDVYQLLNVNIAQCEILKIDNQAFFVKNNTGVKAFSNLKDIQILHQLTENNYIERYNYPVYINAIKNNASEYYQLPNLPFQWAFLTNNDMSYLDISLKTYNYTLKDYYKSIIPASQKYPASLDVHYDGTNVFLVVKGDLYNCMPDEHKEHNYNIISAGFKKMKNDVEIDHQYIDKNIIYTFYKIKFNTNIDYCMTVKTPNKETKDIKYRIRVKDLNWYLDSIDTSGNVINKSFDINLIKQSAIKYVYTDKIRGKWLNYNNEEITDLSKTLLYKLTMSSYTNVEDFVKQINDIKNSIEIKFI